MEKVISENEALYDQDFYAWGIQTAQLIRSGQLGKLALEAVAEEIEDMAKRERREVMSRMISLIIHLLKWKYQPARKSSSWVEIMNNQRNELELTFEQSPSLASVPDETLHKTYLRAVRQAVKETGLHRADFPDQCPFTVKQILNFDFGPVEHLPEEVEPTRTRIVDV